MPCRPGEYFQRIKTTLFPNFFDLTLAGLYLKVSVVDTEFRLRIFYLRPFVSYVSCLKYSSFTDMKQNLVDTHKTRTFP